MTGKLVDVSPEALVRVCIMLNEMETRTHSALWLAGFNESVSVIGLVSILYNVEQIHTKTFDSEQLKSPMDILSNTEVTR